MSHSAVTLRDPVRMKLLFAALDDLDVMQCDMHSAFLSADNLERRHLTAGEQFGHDRKKTFTSVRVPHGLESASAALRSLVEQKLDIQASLPPPQTQMHG